MPSRSTFPTVRNKLGLSTYFKTARKCGIFGVCCEPRSFQVNYLIDEAQDVGKGADATLSLLHHFLSTHSLKEQVVELHADNCVGQNKNNANVHYLLWRVMTGKHKAAHLSFMLVGHTKFAPDRFFGLFKRCFIRSNISTLHDIERAVTESSLTSQHKPQLAASIDGKERYVTWYQWSCFLSQYFKHLPNITSYHSFRVSATSPGIVFAREYSDTPEIQFNLLKNTQIWRIDADAMPDIIEPKGLDAKRQWYLYEQIRPFCQSTLQADLTCPHPIVFQSLHQTL